MFPRSRRSLAWKLYFIGFLQLVVLASSVVTVGYLLRPIRAARRQALESAAERGAEGPSFDRWQSHAPRHPPLLVLFTFFGSGLVIVGVGSYLTARWIVRPLEKLSRTAAAFGAGDLGARVALARTDELGDVGRSFDDMAGHLEQLLKAERELLANVSHELRTPLARIRVALDLATEAKEGDQGEPLAEINADLTEVEGLIDDIITTARLQIEERREGQAARSGLALHAEEIPPAVLCDRAAERFRSHHPQRILEVRLGETLPNLRADAVLLRRAIGNVLENADKYSPDPGSPVVLAVHGGAGVVTFEVTDQGIGIPEADRSRVFAPFFRSDRSRSRGTGGVGLGLTLAKRIVEAHGGSIEVASDAPRGTTMRIALPTARTFAGEAGATAGGHASSGVRT